MSGASRDQRGTDSHARPETLDAVLADAWAQLCAGADSAKHGFHLPTLATTDPNGRPESRIVVLRAADPEQQTLVANTDIRSPKAASLRTNPLAAWTFYDAQRRVQVRASGPTDVLTDGELVEQHWDASTASSRRCYLAPAAPGTPTDGPSPNLPEAVRDRVPELEVTEPGRANFAVIRTVVTAMDVLHLHHAGHVRAGFSWREPPPSEPDEATWLEV